MKIDKSIINLAKRVTDIENCSGSNDKGHDSHNDEPIIRDNEYYVSLGFGLEAEVPLRFLYYNYIREKKLGLNLDQECRPTLDELEFFLKKFSRAARATISE